MRSVPERMIASSAAAPSASRPAGVPSTPTTTVPFISYLRIRCGGLSLPPGTAGASRGVRAGRDASPLSVEHLEGELFVVLVVPQMVLGGDDALDVADRVHQQRCLGAVF